jgi:BASS family bile acid:Na+ symporter
MNAGSLWQATLVFIVVSIAVLLRFSPKLRGYQFTAWIMAAVTTAMIYPGAFLKWGQLDLRNKWLILLIVQTVMFGMGTQMSLRDFTGVVRSPRGVLVGIVCHFSVMPLVGFALTKIFHFEPEIAAGIILIGSCSSGLASNVMAYIAKSNLALSVTVTAITTMIAPLMTPLWMKLLANKLVPTSYVDMMIEIIKIVLVPIGAALLHDYLKHASASGRKFVFAVAAVAVTWLGFIAAGGWNFLRAHLNPTALTFSGLIGFLFGAVIVGVLYHRLTLRLPKLDSWMPRASMFGIVYFTLVTTAAGRDNLLKIGGLLFLAAAMHNLAGYFFGYWLSRAARLDKNSARSVAFEVGLQNGGMASGIAGKLGMLGTLGLAAAIFSPWMNVSGSILANYWRKRPVTEQDSLRPDSEKLHSI